MLLSLLLVWGAVSASEVQPIPLSPAAPFHGWLNVESAYVHEKPDSKSPVVGTLRRGDNVLVSGCTPSCDAKNAWALLGTEGAVLRALLRTDPEGRTEVALSAASRYVYGNVRGGGAPLHVEPDSKHLLGHLRGGLVVAFHPNEELLKRGWLERASGGYIALADVRLAKPSTFSGEHNPAPLTAFVVRPTELRTETGTEPVARYARFAVQGLRDGRVVTDRGTLPRNAVRLATAHPRPLGVPATARWVHVDLTEQTLTAYEGDKLVFATLVSTGKPGKETVQGLMQVWLKTVHHRMSGPPEDPYVVDEVPFTMYFRGGFALHGAFWHDAFGSVVSHGCVNLSMADAEWLFGWAPPQLPDGWHAVLPTATRRETLFVEVRKDHVVLPPVK